MKTLLLIPFLVATSTGAAQTAIGANDALAIAAKNRLSLQSAKLKITQAQHAARAMGAYPSSTLGLGASTRGDVGATDQDLLLNQPIDLFGRRLAGHRMGQAGVQIAIAEYRAAASELQAEVLSAYANAVATQHQRDVSKELFLISESLFIATRRRFDEGKVAEIQIIRANIELERAKQAQALRAADHDASVRRLAGLMGVGASEIELASGETLKPLESSSVDSRSDLLLLRAQIVEAEAEVAVARASNRPELSLQLIRSPWGEARGHFGGRAQLTWDFFDDNRSRSAASSAHRKAEAASKLLDDTTLRAKAELGAAQIELKARQERIASYEVILASVRDLVAKSQRGYAEGFGIQTDVLEAARALREVEQELVEALHQLWMAVIAQYRATGFLAEVFK